ncbi:glycosyltransferase [Clostridium neonatale]|uniref:glycosyltransferase n=1 Tax=Clostridium neonatale TaxID=137838 RepID=UPI001E5A8DD3|nr:glycosyltransferase [Clostridium neonatale]
MSKCMQIDKPLVSILLAVYKPNEKWLIEQLVSLNEQSYNNLELLVYDDCPEHPVNEELFNSNITNFSFKIIRRLENKGSNIAFEELTRVGNGEYFAYCDQDDIWEKDKISLMMEKFDEEYVTLVCSDLSIIDENSKKTHESIRDIRKRIIYKSGYGLAKDLLISNFVTGCAMIVRKDIAIKAIPFLDELVHDQWIAIIAALNGKIEFIDKQLIRYRQHSNNQTGILKDVYDKKSYYERRIDDFYDRYIAYKQRLASFEELRNYIENSIKWIEARKSYSNKVSLKDLKIMIKYRNFHKVSILIEIVLPFIPNFIFKYIIKLAQKGML